MISNLYLSVPDIQEYETDLDAWLYELISCDTIEEAEEKIRTVISKIDGKFDNIEIVLKAWNDNVESKK